MQSTASHLHRFEEKSFRVGDPILQNQERDKLMLKNRFRLILTAGVAAAMLLASLPSRSANAAAVTNLRIFVGLGTGSDTNQTAQEDALAKVWNDAHPDIQIKFEYTDNASARDVLLTQEASGNVPDIVGPVGIGGLNATSNFWADLSSYIKKDTAALNLKDFEQATLNLYQLNGKDIAIPLGIYPSFLFINKDLFDQAGLPLPPTDYSNGKPTYQGKPWDMAAVQDLAIKLTQDKAGKFADEKDFDPTKIAVYGYADVDDIFRGYIQNWSPGHAGVAKDGKTAIFNDKTILAAMQWRHDAVFKYHFFPDLAAQALLNNSGSTQTLAAGSVAMVYSHTWALDGIKDVKFKWVAAVPPLAPNGKLTARINADTFAVMNKSTHKDQAWQVLKWLTSAEISPKACAIYGCLPARLPARADWEKQTTTDYPSLDLKIVFGAVPYLDNPNSEAPMPNFNQASDALTQFMSSLDSDPNFNVATELNKLNTQMQLIFDGKAPTSTPAPEATAAATAATP